MGLFVGLFFFVSGWDWEGFVKGDVGYEYIYLGFVVKVEEWVFGCSCDYCLDCIFIDIVCGGDLGGLC